VADFGSSSRRLTRSLPDGVIVALGAALVFGASTPFAKRLGDGVNPAMAAGLLYLGSGLALGASSLLLRSGARESALRRSDVPALGVVVVFGGMLAPLLLLVGLRTTPAATASLLLNLEAVFTALGAWLIAREHADRRIIIGMVVIVAGAALLSLQPNGRFGLTAGALAIAGACAAWGIDNVASRPLSDRDPRHVAAVKGIGAGLVNTTIGLATGGRFPAAGRIAATMAVGLLGYGMSLVLYLRAVRRLGTARTGAYYSAAPFIGAAIGFAWLREPLGRWFVPALVLMIIGLALHITEDHEHDHEHAPLRHAHGHDHDDHHTHTEAHTGAESLDHTHEPVRHRHGHTPDAHHRHDH
jgi:drug/metabolite transporter (DMT)-like permease